MSRNPEIQNIFLELKKYQTIDLQYALQAGAFCWCILDNCPGTQTCPDIQKSRKYFRIYGREHRNSVQDMRRVHSAGGFWTTALVLLRRVQISRNPESILEFMEENTGTVLKICAGCILRMDSGQLPLYSGVSRYPEIQKIF
jgi:hypothetical protein